MTTNPSQSRTPKSVIEFIIFQSRWLLVPFYIGLIIAQIFYCFKFTQTVWELIHQFGQLDETKLMLMVLTLIDITMIANLIKMIIGGSYQTLVEKISVDHSEKIGSGMLKVKMGSSLIGVSSIHLLQTFINSHAEPTRDIIVKCAIHIIFLISTLGLAYIDYLHQVSKPKSEAPNEH